jgi:hypothetical protein
MVIAGICGAIGSGKSTLAELLVNFEKDKTAHLETSTVVIELARTFNQAFLAARRVDPKARPNPNELIRALLPQLSQILGRQIILSEMMIEEADKAANPSYYEKLDAYYDFIDKNAFLLNEDITPTNKSNYRSLLQWIGAYMPYRLNEPALWPKELYRRIQTLPESMSLVVVTAPRSPEEADYIHAIGGYIILIERPLVLADRTDVTERHVAEIKPEAVVTNDGNLVQLTLIAQELYRDLQIGTLQPHYTASHIKDAGAAS